MARNKALAIFLVVVLVLAIVIAPLFAAKVQISLTAHIAQEGSSFINAGSAAIAVPDALACEGCSGGGSGPY